MDVTLLIVANTPAGVEDGRHLAWRAEEGISPKDPSQESTGRLLQTVGCFFAFFAGS